MNILFVASEAGPFIRTGGLGDVVASLPKALVKEGLKVAVILPFYGEIDSKYRSTAEFVNSLDVPLGWRNQYAGLFRIHQDGVVYYFVDNEYYFMRKGLYGHFDDGERFAFFSKAVLELLPLMEAKDNFFPDIIHCNDWQSALTPLMLDTFYRFNEKYQKIRTVLSIHNIEFQGRMDSYVIENVFGLPESVRSVVEYKGDANMLKAGIESSHKVNTVSPSYANEILDPYFAYGLENILKARQFKLSGILNGIDTNHYDPSKDPALFSNYSVKTVNTKKDINKTELQRLLGLPVDANKPLIGMVGRLTAQKGVDLLLNKIHDILSMDLQLVVLGTGDWKYENAMQDMQKQYPMKLISAIYFSADMASKIYAGSDMFLMPSKFEPCGLSQMISMRYGSVPIVMETGGLKDTVVPFDVTTGEGLGFTFKTYNADDMIGAIYRAVDLYYNDKANWNKLRINAMKADFSWDKSAKEYIALYKSTGY